MIGYNSYRVRVVEFPIDPYLQWEMHRFRIRVECGENIRIVGPEAVAGFETGGIVPELIFMGSLAMYEVLYDETGALASGRKFTDPELIVGCRAEVQALHAQGEDFRTFFEREIAPLPAPVVEPNSARSRVRDSTTSTSAVRKSTRRAHHVELMRMAMDDPRYMECWGLYLTETFAAEGQYTYVNLIVAHCGFVCGN